MTKDYNTDKFMPSETALYIAGLQSELQQVKAERDKWRGKALAMADLDPWIAEQCGVTAQEDKG